MARGAALLQFLLLLGALQEGCLVHGLKPGARKPSVFEASMGKLEEFWRKHPGATEERDRKYLQNEELERKRVAEQVRRAAKKNTVSKGFDSPGADLEASPARRRLMDSDASFSTLTKSRLGLAFPPLLSLVPRSALNSTYYRHASVSPPSSVDWRYTAAMTPVATQLQCESCWAMCVADAISIMVNLQSGLGNLPQTAGPYATAPPSWLAAAPKQLSPQQIMDCTNGAAADSCQGGWPEWAFEYAELSGGLASAASYPYLAKQGSCQETAISVSWLTNLIDSLLGLTDQSQITGWDRTPIMDADRMKRAVAQQPVVAFMSAVSADFQLYSGGVYGFNGTANCTADLNHVVLIVGYGTDRVAGEYWIIKNTWGPDWGENGFARVAMQDGTGVCGITSAPGLFPVNLQTKFLQSPCATMFPPPCGAGACYAQWFFFTAIPRCKCPPGFVENFYRGVAACVPADPCAQNPSPCGPGACSSNADGSYSCSCQAGTVIGATTTGAATCVASTGVATYTAVSGDTCQSVKSSYGLTSAQFMQYNAFVNCSGPIPAGLVLAVGPSGALPSACAAAVATRFNPKSLGKGVDTLASISRASGVSVAALLQLNPSLASPPTAPTSPLPPGMQVCVGGYQAPAAAPAPLACGQSYTVLAGGGRDNCSNIASVYFKTNVHRLLQLNPGLDCSQPLPPQAAVCVKAATAATLPAVNCTKEYFVKAGDNCPLIWNAANLTASQFFLLNPGIQCDEYNLLVGQRVCVAGPQTTTFSTAIPYTTVAHDTLSLVARMFLARCGYYATPLSICTASGLANCTAPLRPSTELLVPCQWPVGRSCGCPSGGVAVCGADGQWYPNYCSAVCNYATPANAYTNNGCSDVSLACAGHSCFGTPDWIEVGFPVTCPWPTWWPINYDWWGTDVCSFYRGACWQCCTGSIGSFNQGYPSAAWYYCYESCKNHVHFGC